MGSAPSKSKERGREKESARMDSNQIQAPLIDGVSAISEGFVKRWIVVICFLAAGAANAMTLLTWSPIFDQAVTYFSGPLGNDGVDTAVNMMFSAFQIMFLPGTLAGVYVQKTYGLRWTLLYAGLLTTSGLAIRWVAATVYSENSVATYVAVLIGTLLVAQAQPVYLNLPTMISLTWFPVSERDFAMTILSLANTAGSAVGSVIPAIVVKTTDSDIDSLKPAFASLLLIQVITAAITFIMVFFFFGNAPKIPPSIAAEKLQNNNNNSVTDPLKNNDSMNDVVDIIMENGTNYTEQSIYDAVCTLMKNPQYVKVFVGFASGIASLNSLASLLGNCLYKILQLKLVSLDFQ